MSERSHLVNGRFTHDLDAWVAVGAEYSAGDGDDHFGVAVLAAGEYITQVFSVPYLRTYTLSIDAKPTGTALSGSNAQAIITDGDGNTVTTIDLDGIADTWTPNVNDLGLAPGTSYTLKIINNDFGADLKIDDVWIYHVPITRAAIAARLHAKLGRLASNRSWSTAADGDKTEGNYTYSIDAGLRELSAINPETGIPDIRYLDPNQVNEVVDLVHRDALEALQADYSAEVDISVGPYRESRKQTAEGIGAMLGGKEGGSTGRVVQRKLIHRREDFTFDQ